MLAHGGMGAQRNRMLIGGHAYREFTCGGRNHKCSKRPQEPLEDAPLSLAQQVVNAFCRQCARERCMISCMNEIVVD